MKKFIFVLLALLLFVLVIRFVEYSPAPSASPKPEVACSFAGAPDPQKPYSCEALAEINQNYLSTVKPIFEQKCLMCHGFVQKMPLYAKIPPSSWLIDHDIREAKEHFDMSYDFPFNVAGDFDEDLDEVAEVVNDGSMPPMIYKIMHWHSTLTPEEKDVILKWVRQSRDRLEHAKPSNP